MGNVQRSFFFLAAFIILICPHISSFLLETNFDFWHSSFRRDLGFTQCSRGMILTLSHIGPEPNISHSFIPETYFCICPGCQ